MGKITTRLGIGSRLKPILRTVSPLWGRKLLTKPQTLSFLQPFAAYSRNPSSVFLPYIDSINGTPLFSSSNGSSGLTIDLEPDFVWRLSLAEGTSDLRVVATGNVVVNRRIHLNLDFSPAKGLLVSQRLAQSETALVYCWAHGWSSYYDFIIFILTKLVRIEHAFGPAIWGSVKIAYPRKLKAYEQDFFDLLGVDTRNVINTRSVAGAIGATEILAANSHSYPSLEDVLALRERFSRRDPGSRRRRLYISRRHTRRVRNEDALRPILDQFGIEFVEDVPRTVAEQIELFGTASLIVGPHGAGFTNILWSAGGATVAELFGRNYFPPCYYYLAQNLGHDYACWIEPGGSQNDASRYDDFHVDPDGLRRLLETAVRRPGR